MIISDLVLGAAPESADVAPSIASSGAAPGAAASALAGSGPGDLGGGTFSGMTVADLDQASTEYLDSLHFGVVGMDQTGLVTRYNLCEAKMAGLSRESVLGQEFFLTTGACMNNYLVAQRFKDEPVLDVTLDYVLTFRMRPTAVKLRMLKHPEGEYCYVLVHR